MPVDPAQLRLATPDEIADTLSLALRFDGRKRIPQGDTLMARIVARRRCLVPASHYHQFTGTKSPKTRWRFTRADEDWFCFAGLLGRGKDGEAFTLLTADAGPDVAPIHNRQPVVLDREAWAAWLDGAAGLLGPSPAGGLAVAVRPRGG